MGTKLAALLTTLTLVSGFVAARFSAAAVCADGDQDSNRHRRDARCATFPNVEAHLRPGPHR